MASRLKKFFSRKKNQPNQPNQLHDNEDSSRVGNQTDSSTLRTSLYETAPAAAAPETGSYPIKGDHTSPALAGRRGSSRSRRYHSNSKIDMPLPPMPPSQQQTGFRPTSMNPSANNGGVRMVQDGSDMSDNFSNLRLNDRTGGSHMCVCCSF